MWQLPSNNAQRRVRVVVGLTDGSSGACRFTPPRRRNEKRGQASRQTTGKQHHHAKSYLHDNTYISVMSYCRLSVLYNKSRYTIIYAPIIDFVFRSSLTAQPPSPAASWSFIALLRWHNLLSLKKRRDFRHIVEQTWKDSGQKPLKSNKGWLETYTENNGN